MRVSVAYAVCDVEAVLRKGTFVPEWSANSTFAVAFFPAVCPSRIPLRKLELRSFAKLVRCAVRSGIVRPAKDRSRYSPIHSLLVRDDRCLIH
jgi:hypothetical protein